MAVKKGKKTQKTVTKKPVKKATNTRKTVVAKKPAAKKIVKKVVKKAVKKVAAKKTATKKTAVKKPVKKTVKPAVKKIVKVAVKKVAVKKPVKVPTPAVTKSVAQKAARAPQKPQPVSVQKPVDKNANIKKVEPNRKMTNMTMTRDVFEEISVIEPIQRIPSKKATTLLGSLEFMPYQPQADEAYMSEQQRTHFRKILDAWKQQLMQDVDLTVGHLKEEAVFYADPVDRAAQEEGFNLELRTRDRERKLIKKIEQSLDLLNTGEYGFCEDCGAEIGIRRLEARPTAVKCIDCKTFQEIREKQLGG